VDPLGLASWEAESLSALVNNQLTDALLRQQIRDEALRKAFKEFAAATLSQLGSVQIIAYRYYPTFVFDPTGAQPAEKCTCCALWDEKPSAVILGQHKVMAGVTVVAGFEFSLEVTVAVKDYHVSKNCKFPAKTATDDTMDVTLVYTVDASVGAEAKGATLEAKSKSGVKFSFEGNYTLQCRTGKNPPGGKKL